MFSARGHQDHTKRSLPLHLTPPLQLSSLLRTPVHTAAACTTDRHSPTTRTPRVLTRQAAFLRTARNTRTRARDMSKRPAAAAAAAAASKSGQGLSVVVPCYAEQDNVKELADRLVKACDAKNINLDLLFMDDESDGTEATKAVVEQLKSTYGSRIRIHCRTRAEGRGLSSAVILGFKQAKHDVLLVSINPPSPACPPRTPCRAVPGRLVPSQPCTCV